MDPMGYEHTLTYDQPDFWAPSFFVKAICHHMPSSLCHVNALGRCCSDHQTFTGRGSLLLMSHFDECLGKRMLGAVFPPTDTRRWRPFTNFCIYRCTWFSFRFIRACFLPQKERLFLPGKTVIWQSVLCKYMNPPVWFLEISLHLQYLVC